MTTQKKRPSWWGKELRRLDGLPLLPCGAGDTYKAPLLSGWQNKRFSLDEVVEFPGLRCIGMRCGPEADGLLTIDFDGESAIDYAVEKFNFDLSTINLNNWIIVRDSDENRFKLVVKVPKSQWDDLPGKTVIKTGEKEQIEFFWSSGQVIVAGEHVSSGDKYHWADTGPGMVSEIPLSLFALWRSGFSQGHDHYSSRSEGSRTRQEDAHWIDCIPCPICGRTEHDCRQSRDKKVILCHYGSRWSPPLMAKGEMLVRGGITWAYCGDKTTAVGESALFRIHEEQSNQALRQKRVEPGFALKLMAQQLGDVPRLNVRSRGIHINGAEATATQTENLYLRLSMPPSPNKWSQKIARDAFIELAHEHEFDPVEVYLNNLKADPLADEDWHQLSRFMFDISDPITDAFMPRFLVGAVARVITPGCQLRQTPVLLGGQGIGKTEMGRALFGHEFYGDGLSPALDIDDVTRLQFVWGMELGELNGITRQTQQEKLKAFLSRRVDLVRRKYAPGTEPIQRRSTFWATTNKSPLTDNTGSSRFVMIPLGSDKLPVSRVKAARDAIWARALREYRNGYRHWSTDEEMDEILARNSDYDLVDPWLEPLREWVLMRGTTAYIRRAEVYDFLDIPKERQNNYNAQRIRELMTHLGWVTDRRRIDKDTWVRAFWNPRQPD
ncbi:bifunctional DNA primase/polymerase [Synechococcus sp. AH-551-N17]|nr:bifunctional DNA primase/polymerase [Synechococcus sp. AH-551-N17]